MKNKQVLIIIAILLIIGVSFAGYTYIQNTSVNDLAENQLQNVKVSAPPNREGEDARNANAEASFNQDGISLSEKPIPAGVYPYYYATPEEGVWRKNSPENEPILVYKSPNINPSGDFNRHIFRVINNELVVAMYDSNTPSHKEPDLNECRYNTSTESYTCNVVDSGFIGVGEKIYVAKVPNEDAYVYLSKTQEPESTNLLFFIPQVHAQVPYDVDVKKRLYAQGLSETITNIQESVGCGGGSWHTDYYHGTETNIMVTSDSMLYLENGCNGTVPYIIDLTSGEKLDGAGGRVKPVEIMANTILFHRKNDNLNHSFITVPSRNPQTETTILHLDGTRYVTDLVYSDKTDTAYYSSIVSQEVCNSPKCTADSYILEVGSFNPDSASASQRILFEREAYNIDDLQIRGNFLLYTLSDSPRKKVGESTVFNFNDRHHASYVFDLSTNEHFLIDTKKIHFY